MFTLFDIFYFFIFVSLCTGVLDAGELMYECARFLLHNNYFCKRRPEELMKNENGTRLKAVGRQMFITLFLPPYNFVRSLLREEMIAASSKFVKIRGVKVVRCLKSTRLLFPETKEESLVSVGKYICPYGRNFGTCSNRT